MLRFFVGWAPDSSDQYHILCVIIWLLINLVYIGFLFQVDLMQQERVITTREGDKLGFTCETWYCGVAYQVVQKVILLW